MYYNLHNHYNLQVIYEKHKHNQGNGISKLT